MEEFSVINYEINYRRNIFKSILKFGYFPNVFTNKYYIKYTVD